MCGGEQDGISLYRVWGDEVCLWSMTDLYSGRYQKISLKSEQSYDISQCVVCILAIV